MSALRETRFSDVCGTVDELKRVLNEEPEAGARDAGQLVGLVEDCASMIERMELRFREFQQFRDEVARLSQRMGEIGDSRRPFALAVDEDMAQRLRAGRALT